MIKGKHVVLGWDASR